MAGGKKTWEKQKAAVRKIQLAFDLSVHVQKQIKRAALEEDLSPSDKVREILDLDVVSKKVRERITFSLTDEELIILAKRYGIDSDKRTELRRRIAEELVQFAESTSSS